MGSIPGQRIRLTSFLVPPLPKEIFIKYGKYKKLKHWANIGFYGTHITLFKKIVKLVALQITLKGQLRSLSNSYLRGDEDV